MTTPPTTSMAVPADMPAAQPTHAPGAIDKAVLGTFVAVPLAAVVVGAPVALAYGWVTWLDLVMLAVIYTVGVHGITIGADTSPVRTSSLRRRPNRARSP